MRTYIITELEQKIIKAYLEKGEKSPGFRMLLSRLKTLDLADVRAQIELIEAFLKEIRV